MRTTLAVSIMIGLWGWSAAGQVPKTTSSLQDLVAAGRLSDLRWADFADYRSRVHSFYESIGYTRSWIRNCGVTPSAAAIITALKQADLKGLHAEDYDGPRWADRIAKLTASSTAGELDRFDLALSVCLMRYVSDLHIGRVNPGLFHDKFDFGDQEDDLPGFVRRHLKDAQDENVIRSALESVEPPFQAYWRAQVALQHYLVLAQGVAFAPLPVPKKTVEPGGSYAGTLQLIALLRRLGDLAPDTTTQINANSNDVNRYEGPVVEAVRHFQLRHGLDPDGRLGTATIQQLNTPLERRAIQLALALERFRWVPHRFDHPPIVVNIPEFRLRALNRSNTTELEMKVVVGKAYRHQTPSFAADMNTVIFRPYWNVPRSIERDELVPKIDQDRLYLARNGYEVVTPQNRVVTNGAIDDATLDKLRSGALQIRQVPGDSNSLGLVKFLFPNEHDVYLHDTPARTLFSKSRRDFSHGCIRVENPAELAAWVLRDFEDWPPARILEAMHGEETIEVTLMRPIPVLIVYATAVVLESGEAHFFDDIYKQDAKLEALLRQGYGSPAWNPTNVARALRPRE